ncbi:MAG TPA: hypothetical protein VGM51_18985 [Armatimonadota bacterium]|jgi:hypothetical protein
MKRGILAVAGALAMAFIAQPRAASGPLILAKDAGGPIVPTAVSLDLRSSPACDQTLQLIPDGSKLVSESFLLNIDDKGIGFFSGPVRIVAPDGTVVISGLLHGTAGLTAGVPDATKSCYLPGHLEGMLTGGLISPSGTTTGGNGQVSSPLELNFQADLQQQSASPVPLYKGRLVGLLPPPPPPPPPPPSVVTIDPGKFEFSTNEAVIAIIANRTSQAIQIFDEQSYCTIVQLQRQVGTDWQMVGGCPLLRIPLPKVIPAGTVLKVLLPEAAIPEFVQEPGVYRMVIDWQYVGPDGTGVGGFTKAISPLFKVVVPPPPVPLVKVMSDKPLYPPNGVINAIIANGPTPVRIFDEQSLCTIVQLQRFDGTGWVLESGCPWDRMPMATILRAGETRTVPLARDVPWITGQYRLAVTFAPVDSTGQTTGPDQTVFSMPFLIAVPPPTPAVTLTSDKSSYSVSQPIIATIANGSNIDVATWDHRSFCTVVNLQFRDVVGWRTIAPCLLMTPTMPVIVKAGQKIAVTLPGDPTTNTINWRPGVYRLQAVFGTPNSAGAATSMFEVVSAQFMVTTTTSGIAPAVLGLSPITLN